MPAGGARNATRWPSRIAVPRLGRNGRPGCGVIEQVEDARRPDGKLTSTISSPIQVHGITKVPAKRAPEIGEHNEEVLKELGFDAKGIDGLRASGAITGGGR